MNKIQKLIQNGYELDGDQIYNDTFNIYKKLAIPAGLILFLLSIILGGVYMIILFSVFDSLQEIKTFSETFNIFDLSILNLTYYTLGNSVISGITSIFSAGFIKMAYDVYRDKLPKFGSVFTYFTKIEGFKIFIFSLCVQLILNVISFYLDSIGLSLVSFFLMILINLLTLLVIPFIIFEKMPIHKALFASISLVNQKPFKIMSYLILLGLLSICGVFLFIIGVFFSIPILFCFNYSIYENIINKN